MKTHILPALKMSLVCLLFFSGVYTGIVWLLAQVSPNHGQGEVVKHNGKVVGYAHIGQAFTKPEYFQSRPSAVNYNAAGSGGSNKGPANNEYLAAVEARVDTFLAHNPAIARRNVPIELVTASASGLDPDLSPAAANVQVPRIAALRNINEQALYKLVESHTERPPFGPAHINLLNLNIALNQIPTK
jgi:K+-transporting ATPase ATPase C chain